MMKKILVPINTIAIILSMSCSKPANNQPDEQILDSSSQLAAGKWQIVASTYQKFSNGIGGVLEDEYNILSACQKDNYMVYTADKSIIENEGVSKCSDTTKQQKLIGNWQLIDADKTLRVISQNIISGIPVADTTDWIINELSKTTLKLIYIHNGGTTYRFETVKTYKHID